MPPNAVDALLEDPEWAEQSVPIDQADTQSSEAVPEEPEEEEVEAGPETEAEPGEETEDAEEEEDEAGEDEGEEESDDGDEDAAESDADVVAESDPEVRAFLAKYGNDPEKALKGAAHLALLLGRQGRDLSKVQEENAQLRAALSEAQAVSAGMATPLNEQQREWVEGAAQSVNPAAFVQQAAREGQFELARAVCREWALTAPYEALRTGQWVDATEAQVYQAAMQPQAFTTDQILAALDEEMPEMRPFYGQMTQVVAQLGEGHPLVLESHSADPEEAMRGLIGLYEIARASTATVEDAHAEVKKRRRKEADDERAKGQVSSGTNSPSHAETPRDRTLMPGLTQEALDTEFAAQAGR